MAKKPNNPETALRRASARLAAVQALYQIEMGGVSLDDTVRDFLNGAIGGTVIVEDTIMETEEEVALAAPDAELFAVLVRGAHALEQRLDEIISRALAERWDVARLEPVLRAILRCGIYELLERPKMPARAAVSEYVDIARAFYDTAEAGMVNAVLDRVAREVREDEMHAPRRAPGMGREPSGGAA